MNSGLPSRSDSPLVGPAGAGLLGHTDASQTVIPLKGIRVGKGLMGYAHGYASGEDASALSPRHAVRLRAVYCSKERGRPLFASCEKVICGALSSLRKSYTPWPSWNSSARVPL